jgi:hypothetical protein
MIAPCACGAPLETRLEPTATTPARAGQRRAAGHPPRHREGELAHAGRRPPGADAAPGGARFRADAPAHHHRLQRIAARTRDRRARRHRRLPGRADAIASVRLPRDRRRTPVGRQHALRAAGRRGDPDRPLRLVERRPRQERLPPGPGAPLRPAHADDFGHPLQLVDAGHRRPGLLRPDTQLPPSLLPVAAAVRCVARRVHAGCSR